jgi:hypothetical protein
VLLLIHQTSTLDIPDPKNGKTMGKEQEDDTCQDTNGHPYNNRYRSVSFRDVEAVDLV